MKTKISFLSLILIFTATIAYSQNANEVDAYYGVSSAELHRSAILIGGPSYNVEKCNELGIKYLYQLSENFFIETGFNYSKSKIKITPEYVGVAVNSRFEELELISIPVYANYTFWKFLFLNGGIIIDLQKSDNSFDPQSGIGIGIGIGAKYKFHNFVVFINPNFKQNTLIEFNNKSNHQKLTEVGIQMGFGYTF